MRRDARDPPVCDVPNVRCAATARLRGPVHARRRDFARLWKSAVRASMIFQPCLLPGERNERIVANWIAPSREPKPLSRRRFSRAASLFGRRVRPRRRQRRPAFGAGRGKGIFDDAGPGALAQPLALVALLPARLPLGLLAQTAHWSRSSRAGAAVPRSAPREPCFRPRAPKSEPIARRSAQSARPATARSPIRQRSDSRIERRCRTWVVTFCR